MQLKATLTAALLVAGAVATPHGSSKPPKGFVTTKGTKFQLNGKDFPYVGTNAYYFAFSEVRLTPSMSWFLILPPRRCMQPQD
jgi:mannan endo-1,4-beta-mannosidase